MVEQRNTGINYYDFDRLCQEAVERNFKGDGNTVGSVISGATYALCWSAFTKWCAAQIEVNRAVTVAHFGIIGFQPLREQKKIVYVKLSDQFLENHGLQYSPTMAEFEAQTTIVLGPLIKPNIGMMAKSANTEKGAFFSTLSNIFMLIGELLSELPNVEIDLSEFGKFQAMNKQVMYAPMNKMKPAGLQGKQTVKALMDFGTQGQRGGQLQPLDDPRLSQEQLAYQAHQAQQMYQASAQFSYSSGQGQRGGTLSAMLFKSNGQQATNHGVTLNESPTRRYRKPYNDGKITSELLGAGDDPMSKNQEFSLLAGDPRALMNQNFKKPSKAVSRFPPVIDPFSRTLAAPVSSQRHYLSVSHRIGTNFTPSGKGFYIDVDTRTVRYKNINDSGAKLDIVNEDDIQPASEAEEYKAVMDKQVLGNPHVHARKVSYTRYRQYIENEIQVDVIAPIRQYWLTHIIELIPGDLHAVEKERIEYLIDTMLNEINKDYFDSVRKSILDYILKDENEMRRLGIQQVINKPITWGQDYYKGIEPDEYWKHNVMMARMLMSETLCICSQATLELLRIWREKEYCNTLLVDLLKPEDPPVDLDTFITRQGKQIDQVRHILNKQWKDSAVDILREELENLDRDQTQTFFDSVATLMSNQARELATNSINEYVEFFRRFRKENNNYPLPEEIIRRDYGPDEQFEKTFLTLKLEVNTTTNTIGFQKPLNDVRDELIKIVPQMLKAIENIPRADTQIANSDKTHLWQIKINDEIIVNAKTEIMQILLENLQVAAKAVNVYDEYLFLLKESEQVAEFLENPKRVKSEYIARIQIYTDIIKKIKSKSPYEIRMSMFLVQCHELNNKLIFICEKLINDIVGSMCNDIVLLEASQVCQQVKSITDSFGITAKESDELVKFEAELEEIRTKKRNDLQNKYTDLVEWVKLIYQYPQHEAPDEIYKQIRNACTVVQRIGASIEERAANLLNQRRDIEGRLIQEVKDFQAELNDLKNTIEGFKEKCVPKSCREYNIQIDQIKEKLKQLTEKQQSINKKQTDLEWNVEDYPLLLGCQKSIKPYEEFWKTFEDVTKYDEYWNSTPVNELSADEIQQTFKKLLTAMTRCESTFGQTALKLKKLEQLAKGKKDFLTKFAKKIPVIRALTTKGLKESHINKMAKKLGLSEKTDVTKQPLSSLENAETNIQFLEAEADFAFRQYTLYNQLLDMREQWKPLMFETVEFKGVSYILTGEAVEQLQEKLDDHTIKTQSMRGSPFIEPFKDEVISWESTLMSTSDNLEVWLNVQATWCYLEPVFSSADIKKQMPEESMLFEEVDKAWKKLMNQVVDNPASLDVIKIPNLSQILKDCFKRLETVQKGLNEYLEEKRGAFPRFYFLSNDELLEILSETKEPEKVQPHLKKCFEGIARLHFDAEKKIHAMYSREGEKVPFTKIIDPVLAKGNVEKWLVEVEDVMLKSVKEFHEKAMQDYTRKEREKWVCAWQGMGVLCVAMMFWTSQAEEAMKKGGIEGLRAFSDKLNKQLEGLVTLVRQDITKLQRCTLEALVVLDVHAKEVIQDKLLKEGIANVQDFAWLKQLRYYWEESDVRVKITNSEMDYNHEYLGNSARLVITPLTDRCYITLCGAIFLNYGGAPEGPAGTGKTETVKDLSKALARQCIVFNCSDGLDYKQMGKMFKGLASCGAWSCLDEFNRIELEVLSVVAQQLQCIQNAVGRAAEFFEFEDSPSLPLKLTCNCFITMNPGYAGRSELPDNLKALFRSVAMMVPDYAMIGEISLYSFGFISGKELATKIVTVYTLCSEQLSSQKHYDYGMRAVKSVLTAAGNLKRKYNDMDESVLMLRAINDVNYAKFLKHDLGLYRNIISDLFPGVQLPEPDYKLLTEAMQNACKAKNLQPHPYFFDKIIQLYEMTIVRHGLMVVGEPFAGKTMCMEVLQAALTELHQKELMPDARKTIINRLNPKSITMGQLYGKADDISHDWQDGVLPVLYRNMANQMSPEDNRWLVFDGPVDAIWIENMNTVLDDNKKLCLMSGEIIQMTDNMNMVFEPMDLQEASPATVSRCGMVYLQPAELGWRPMFNSWKNTLPAYFDDVEGEAENVLMKNIQELVDVVVQPIITFVRRECQETSSTNDQSIIMSWLRIFSALLKNFENESFAKALDKRTSMQVVDNMFLFSIIWSLCITISSDYRRSIDQYLKKILDGSIQELPKLSGNKKLLPAKFDRGLIFDYIYDFAKNEWRHWMDDVDKEQIDQFGKDAKVQEIIVTTVDTVRYSFIQKFCILNDIQTLFVGPTGTGKSVYIQNVLMKSLNEGLEIAKYQSIEIGFSAQTHCNQVQDIIDGKLDKRRNGVFGARLGQKIVIFVDDLNMPIVEKYGAQPPIEILRQMLDQGGWYDLKDSKHPFRTFIDTMLICAMGPPGGGKSKITPRMQRHLNVVAFAFFDDNTMKSIFGSILKWFFRTGEFSSEIAGLDSKIVEACLSIYKQIQLEMKPTPAKSHYTFNLRDFSKIIQGMCLVTKKEVDQPDVLMRLWAHEATRVLGDRLINDADRMWMLHAISETTKVCLGANFDLLFKHLSKTGSGKIESLDEFRSNVFGDIFTPFGTVDRPYEEILDKEKLIKAAEESLDRYNEMADNPMNLVLFNFAIEHLLRIRRILKVPGGHALLVGVGGSGRQSLTRLATKMGDFEIFQIEVKKQYTKIEFREDLKALFRIVGGKGEAATFIFTDNSIKEEGFLEDINNILNAGEVPNIFPADEKADVQDSVRNAAKEENRCAEGTPQQLFSYFVERCKANLHIVLCFSPIGDMLRNRCRNFPSLVNCTTIDWFSEWPKDALESVAQQFLADVDLDAEVRQAAVFMVQNFHTTTQVQAARFLKYQKRNYYVTPTSYLELIDSFKRLLASKRLEVAQQRDRYGNGYTQLIMTEESVGKMQVNLENLKPQLIISSKEVDEKAAIVGAETAIAAKEQEKVEADAAVAQESADKTQAIKDECQKDLDEAIPALEAAAKALNSINQGQIAELKTLKVFVPDVLRVFTAVCILFDKEAVRALNNATGKREEDWTTPTKAVLSEQGLLQKLQNFEKDAIDAKKIEKIQQYITHENFQTSHLKNVNAVAASLSAWVLAMDKYYRVNLVVKPKKAALAIAEKEYAVLEAELNAKKENLRIVLERVATLQSKLRAAQTEKKTLEEKVADCESRLIKAQKLIELLGGQKVRWKQQSEILGEVYKSLTGDVLCSSGMIAYLGAFDSVYRNELITGWVKNCLEKEIPNSGSFSLAKTLGDAVQIQHWCIDGLPSDAFSVENAIITFNTSRWPLYIDPQGQANKWIKTMYKKSEKGLKILKFSDGNYLKQLEAGISMGIPVIIENVGVELDPAIEPVLQKQIIKRGNGKYIKIGDSTISYHDEFQFFLSTKLRNPHYLPEVSTKVTILNFMITYEGLSDQLLGILVAKEEPELEEKKSNLVREQADIRRQLATTENKMLKVLSDVQDILGDEEAIAVLMQAGVLSGEIAKKEEKAAITEKEIDEARKGYKPVALKTAGLFFTIQELANIEPMYQYSLPFFIKLFESAISQAEKSEELEKRLEFLNAEFLDLLFRQVCISLFEKDKLIFSFMLCIKLLQLANQMDPTELIFFLTGGVALGQDYGEKPAEWLTDKIWGEINRMSSMNSMKNFLPHFLKNTEVYKQLYESPNPESWEFPADATMMNNFRKLLVIRAIRPDKVVPTVAKFIVELIGENFVKPPTFELANIYLESRPTTPLIFVLSPGSDPLQALMKFAETKNKRPDPISLGQGQGVKAQNQIEQGLKTGDWVILQNCHLSVKWMPTLEKICEDIDGDPRSAHRDFRLWLTSYPSDAFPVSILQNGIKMTREAKKGLQQNLQDTYMVDPISDPSWFGTSSDPRKFRKLVFGLAFFHAVIQERRLYGPLGWNIRYEFNETDLRISVRQLKIYLDQYPDKTPFDALRYLTAECNYGGRVTDGNDRILIQVLLKDYFNERIFQDDYKFSPSGTYYAPMHGDSESYVQYARSLPLYPDPEVFGFHDNAAITKNLNETGDLLNSLTLTSGDASGGGDDNKEAAIVSLANTILAEVPDIFDMEYARKKYDTDYHQSMNSVLTQELEKYNILITLIKGSLKELKRAIAGEALLSIDLEKALSSMSLNQIPEIFKTRSFNSLKPLGSYIKDLKTRIEFFADWLKNGIPRVFLINKFFFAHGFLTGARQNYARKYQIPIDTMDLDYKVVADQDAPRPDDGVFVMGMYLEGCKWHPESFQLAESDPKILFSACPMVWFLPMKAIHKNHAGIYKTPLYLTMDRRGILATTGHSTNFVGYISLPTEKDPSHWTKRGAALLCTLND